MKKLIFSTAALAMAASMAHAQSASHSESEVPVTAVVTYADLNLDNPIGMNALRTRIRAAAHQVCGQRSRLLAVESRRAACFAQATDGAFRALDARRSTLQADQRSLLTVAAIEPARTVSPTDFRADFLSER